MGDPITWGVIAATPPEPLDTLPTNVGLFAQIAGGVLIALITTWGVVKSKRAQKGSREDAFIDQMQKMIAAERKDRKDSEQVMRGDITKLRDEVKTERDARETDRRFYLSAIRLRDGYISTLRFHIDSGNGPPTPDYPPGFHQ